MHDRRSRQHRPQGYSERTTRACDRCGQVALVHDAATVLAWRCPHCGGHNGGGNRPTSTGQSRTRIEVEDGGDEVWPADYGFE